MRSLTTINPITWREEMESVGEYLESYGDRLPPELSEVQQRVTAELAAVDWPKS